MITPRSNAHVAMSAFPVMAYGVTCSLMSWMTGCASHPIQSAGITPSACSFAKSAPSLMARVRGSWVTNRRSWKNHVAGNTTKAQTGNVAELIG